MSVSKALAPSLNSAGLSQRSPSSSFIRISQSRACFAARIPPAAKQALDWLILMKEELGDRWLRPALFRLGASALLTDIERQLEHFVTGRYAAAHRHPMI